MSEIKRKKDEKKKILEEQLNIIHSEKNKVDADVKVKIVKGVRVKIVIFNK